MSMADAFLQAICDDPDDDTPRLVYADWLEEHGNAADFDRARFIRLQIEAHRLPEFDRRRYEYKREAERLLGRHRGAWLAGLPWWVEPYGAGFFERGFVNSLYVLPMHFLEAFPELPAREPVTQLRVRSVGEKVPVGNLLALPGLERLRHLDFYGHGIKDAGAVKLARCPALHNLITLNLSTNDIGLKGVRALARSQHLQKLEYLDVGPLQHESLAALIGSAHLRRLQRLDVNPEFSGLDGLEMLLLSDLGRRLTTLSLSGSQFGGDLQEAVARRLALAYGVAELTSLSFVWVRIGDAGLAALAGASHLSRVRRLRLLGCSVGAEGLRALAASDVFGGLTRLVVSYTRLDDSALAVLGGTRTLTRLQSLSLHDNHFTAHGMKALGRVTAWPGLAELDLSGCELDDKAVEALASADLLASLCRLDLNRNRFGSAGAVALARSPGVRGLIEVDLGHNQISGTGARALAESQCLGSLRSLKLEHNPVGDEGAVALAGSPLLRQLVELDLTSTGIGAVGVQALCASEHLEEIGQIRLLGAPLPSHVAQQLRARFGGRAQVNG
jgi:uncharacterized protein (TIGR02996 family)